jgi:hypothetical protein
LIEIGKERTFPRGTRKASSFIGAISAILVLLWLVRGFLGLQQYSATLLIWAFALGFLAAAFKVETSRGAARAASSFFGELAYQSLAVIIFIFFLGWVAGLQSDALPAIFYSSVPYFVVALIVFGLLSAAAHGAMSASKGLKATNPALFLRQGSTVDMKGTKVSTKNDSIGLPVRKSMKNVGCVVTGDLSIVFETPMGAVNAVMAGPVTTFGVPFRGEKATDGQVQKATGKPLNELIKETRVETTMVGEAEIEVDLPPFVHLNRDQLVESVDIGPLSLRRGPRGEVLRIGPITIDADDSERWFGRYWGKHGRFSAWWSLKGAQDSYISSSGESIRAKWNGSSLELRQGFMKFKVGSDGFTYSSNELETYTPLHTLRVTKDKVTLNTKRFTLDVIGSHVILRTEDGSKSTDSVQLAKDLRDLLAVTAQKQVSDVLEGQPIELDEMLSGTDGLLKKYA